MRTRELFSFQQTGLNRWVGRLCSIVLFLLLTAEIYGVADQLTEAFDAANRLYEEGKFSDAIAAYQNLLRKGQAAPALYFNLGNAYFKQGQLGRAIASYRTAQALAPRDPDIRANLRFARDRVEGGSRPRSRWDRWTHWVSLNEAILVATGILWIWLLLLAAGQFRREWVPALRPWRLMFGLTGLLAALWSGALVYLNAGIAEAAVISDQAVVRYGPFEEAQVVFTARDGAELQVLGQKDQWLQVTDGSKRSGWLLSTNVVPLNYRPPGSKPR